jgi:hypothetical protein
LAQDGALAWPGTLATVVTIEKQNLVDNRGMRYGLR